MFSEIKEWLKDAIFNRFTILLVIFISLLIVLLQRLFVMQIIDGEQYLNNFKLTIKKENTLKSTRGNIYDRNGKLLAYNKLAYSVTIEDNFESGKNKNTLMNESIIGAIRLVEECGDTVSEEFNIRLNEDGQFEFTVSGSKLTRFLADVYGHAQTDDLKTNERNSTPDDVIDFLKIEFFASIQKVN